MYEISSTYKTKNMSSVTNTYYYGNDVTYQNGKYTLVDIISSSNWSSIWNGELNNNHYTCMGGTTCSTVYYVYYTTSSYMYYIELSNGKNINNGALSDLNNNNKSSAIKEKIDDWYYSNIEQKDYSDYIEDAIWCNDRGILQFGGWEPDSGSTTSYLFFSSIERLFRGHRLDLSCNKKFDRFTVNNENGNGDLDYPVGLLTIDEVILAGGKWMINNSFYLNNDNSWYTMTPYYTYQTNPDVLFVNTDGSINALGVKKVSGIRPSISLAPGVEISGGNGTENNPYIVG